MSVASVATRIGVSSAPTWDETALAGSDVTVLIGGETGSGKGVYARRLHAVSRRSRKPFVVADCSSLTASLFESQLFGHTKGAFTGASAERSGLVRAAEGGTLFLDEVGELAAEQQAMLLTLLEDRTVMPVGSERRHAVDVRFIAATHRDLPAMVEAGTFREDLYYRLAVVELDVPALRDRKKDLPELIEALIVKKAELLGLPARNPSAELMEAFMRYDWPGNIRELGNCIERTLVLSRGPELELSALPPRVLAGLAATQSAPRPSRLTLGRIADEVENACGNKSEAARRLGVSRRHLYRLLENATP